MTELLQRANLLQYEAALLEQGADDLQQLLEVSEEEFQGLLKAIGMASKPFHVMRFRKALGQQVPVCTRRDDHLASFPNTSTPHTVTVFASRIDPLSTTLPLTDPISHLHSSSICFTQPTPVVTMAPTPSTTVTIASTPPPLSATNTVSPPPPPDGTLSSNGHTEDSGNARRVIQIDVSAEELERLVDDSTPVQMRLGPSPFSPDMWDANRREIIHSSSQVFTTSNSRRRNHDLTEHETFMNEAAYRLCLWDPTLLVRREELFTLAKKLVRESGSSGAIQVKYSTTPSIAKRARGCPYPLQRGPDGKFRACFDLNYDMREKQISEVERLLAENVAEEQVKQVLLSEAKRQKDYSSVLQLQEEIAALGQTYRQLRTQLSKVKRKQRRAVRHQKIKKMKDNDEEAVRSEGDNQTTVEKYPSLQIPILPVLAQELNETAAIVAAAVSAGTAVGGDFTQMGGQLGEDSVHKELTIPPAIASEEIASTSSGMQSASFTELAMKGQPVHKEITIPSAVSEEVASTNTQMQSPTFTQLAMTSN